VVVCVNVYDPEVFASLLGLLLAFVSLHDSFLAIMIANKLT
jgi:hypothetical protein